MKNNHSGGKRQKLVDTFLRGLASQLLTTIILPLSILLILITFGGLTIHQQTMRELASERDVRTARAFASAIEGQIQIKMEKLKTVSLQLSQEGTEDNYVPILLKNENDGKAFDAGLGLFTSRGEIVAKTPEMDAWLDLTSTQWILENILAAAEKPKTPIMMHLPNDGSQETTLLMVLYIQQIDKYLIAGFSAYKVIAPIVQNIFPAEFDSPIFVIDDSNEIIFYQGKSRDKEILLPHAEIIQSSSGNSGATYVQTGGEEHVIAFSVVTNTNWTAIIEEPWESIASPLLRITENAPLVLIPVVFLTFIALWLASKRIVQPLQALEAKAAELGSGNFEEIQHPVGGILEIQNLQMELINLARKVRASQQGLRNYINAITLGQEEERRRLARELHDETLQSLIALNQRIQLIRLSIEEGKTDSMSAMIEELQLLNSQNIQNLRRISHGLRPVYLEELGLSAALEMLAQETEKNFNITAIFEHKGGSLRLPSHVELALYRMAQEALNNIVKHAKARQAWITIENLQNQILLEIRDDGRGFEYAGDLSIYSAGGHYGILGLHERAEMIGAAISIETEENNGTCIRVVLQKGEINVTTVRLDNHKEQA